jgi:YD repeat-containing protein
LPAGLSLNASTGVISGMPTAAVSDASLTFQVADSSSPTQIDQAVLDLTIEAKQLTATGVYNYSASYDGNGNVLPYQDTVMGTWNFTYDAFNRLQSGSAVSSVSGSQDFTGQNLCLAYDSFGNRTAQSMQTTSCPSQESSLTPTESYNSNNQIAQSLNLYAYVMNSPLIRTDPRGLDCVYFNNSGNGIESIDPQDSDQNAGTSLDQQSSDCGANGGDWSTERHPQPSPLTGAVRILGTLPHMTVKMGFQRSTGPRPRLLAHSWMDRHAQGTAIPRAAILQQAMHSSAAK